MNNFMQLYPGELKYTGSRSFVYKYPFKKLQWRMNTSVGEFLPAIIFSWNFQMLNIMKIPWVEKCPWLASVATRYSLNVLTRWTEQKETSFMKILPAKHRGGLAGLWQAVIPPKALWFCWGWAVVSLFSPVRALHRHVLDSVGPSVSNT